MVKIQLTCKGKAVNRNNEDLKMTEMLGLQEVF